MLFLTINQLLSAKLVAHFVKTTVNHFCVDFEVCFGSLSCWKVQPAHFKLTGGGC